LESQIPTLHSLDKSPRKVKKAITNTLARHEFRVRRADLHPHGKQPATKFRAASYAEDNLKKPTRVIGALPKDQRNLPNLANKNN
jgi:hypothetical protein